MQKENRQKPRVSAGFVAGAEGLGLRSRSGRLVACVPPARTRPSARGFGVDVGERTRERGKGRCHPILAASPKEGGAGSVLRGNYEGQAAVKSPL